MTPDKIFKAVEDETGVTKLEILGASRILHIVLARKAAMYLCRYLLRMSYPSLGKIFDKRHHSSIMSALTNQTLRMDWLTEIVPACFIRLGYNNLVVTETTLDPDY